MSWQRNKIDNLEKQLKVRSGQLLKALELAVLMTQWITKLTVV